MVSTRPHGVAVVMPTFERRDLLPMVLPPLLDDPTATEVVVVNDGGRDGSLELLREMQRGTDRLAVVDLPHSGRQAARRAGIEAVSADLVLLVDDDVQAAPGLAAGHARAHSAGVGDVVEGYMPVWLEGARRAGQAATRLYAAEYEDHCRALESGESEPLSVLWGGNVSMPTELALQVTAGPDFPASFGEDTHLGLLCHSLGARGAFARDLAARHLHRRTFEQFVAGSHEMGASRWWLHHLHGEVLGPADPDAFLEGLPAGLVALLRSLGAAPLEKLLPGAAALARSAAAAGSFGAETAAARIVRRIAARRGFLQAQAAARGLQRRD